MVTKAKKALLASLAAFLCVMLTVFGLSMSVSLSETAKAADETTTEVAEVNGVKFATLAEAVNAVSDGGEIVVYSGVYTIPNVTYTGKSFTISAGVDQTVSFDMSVAHAIHEAKVSFNNVTFDYKTNNNYIGLQHADTLTYKGCTINGMVFLYATNETFNGCTFNQTSKNAYNVWTYGAKNVAFNQCVFNSAGKSVLVYNEGANPKTDLTVSETKFVASEKVDGKAAIEIDTSLMAGGTTITIDDKTTATNFAEGSNSGSTLWNDKKQTADTNKNTTITVADEVVYAPYVVAIGEVKYFSLTAAIAAAKDGETVKLLADATEDVVVDKNITLDLGGKTLTGTNSGKATLTIAKGATATVKNGSVIGTSSFYNIQNNGTATFETLIATAGNTGSSMIDNWGTLTINSGEYSGGLNVVKSEEGSVLTINGGEFTRTSAPSFGITGTILVYGTTTITGGEFIDNTSSANARVLVTGVVKGYTAITKISGGKFTNKKANIFHWTSPATPDNFEISGGIFNKSIPYYICADGFIPAKNADGTYGVKPGKYVADVEGDGYETLAKAIAAAEDDDTVTLLDNINENIVIEADKNFTLDLNGYTINGGTGTAKAAITNHGTLTITDSSAKKTGTIKRDDNGVEGETSYYVIRNLGTMTIEQANVINNSGYRKTNPSGSMVGSSLICNGDNDEGASFTINGGKLKQLNFIAIKNGANGTLVVNGGEITSNHSAVQNWFNAELTGGTIRGQLWTDAWKEGESVGNTVIGGNVDYEGEIVMDVTGSTKPELKVDGGNLSVTNWRITTACAALGGKPAVSGGTFNHAILPEYCAKGFIPTQNADGTFGVKEGTYVAEVNGVKYETLQAAIDAALEKAIVTLLADTRENVTIAKRLTLDLNGYTVNGGKETRKPAVTVTARVTIKDSSEAQTGTIMREDTAENSGVSSHYVIDVQGNGWLTFESGNVKNNSGAGGTKGASLVRVGDDSVAKYPGLNIKGGTFTQNNFIVIKIDRGDLFLNGGTLNSANTYAIENWKRATVKGGTVNGAVSSWTYPGGSNSELTISGGTINGDVTSVNYGNATDKKATVSVTGGTIKGELDTRSYDPATGKLTSINDAAKATIEVSGGTFTNTVPADYCAEGFIPTKNADGTFGVEKTEKVYLAKVGETSYCTMEEAFEAQTASGEAIVLLRDYTTGSEFKSGTKHRVVDLNGHTWTYTGSDADCAAFEINNPNATLTVKNGTIISNSLVGLIPSAMKGTITYDNAGLVFENVEMTSNGHSGIETNGNNTNDSVTLKNSTLNVPNGFGIYFPSSGTLTIDNSTIIAETMGVQVCSGKLNINAGSAITVTGDSVPKTENDGAIQDGAAISVVNRAGYKGLSDIVITGGKFTAKGENKAIKAYDWAEKTESAFTKADLVAVSGGTFSSEVNKDYLANGFRLTKTGESYGVTAKYIESTHVSLGTALSFSYKLRTLEKGETIKNAKASYRTVRGNLVEIDMTLVDGYYVFDGITPQMLDRKISVNVYIGDTVVYDVVDYSILDYLQDLLSTDLGTKATVTKQLVADLAFYGKAAMKYVGYTTTVVDKFIADNGLTQSTGEMTGVATSSGTEKVANVSVQFASQNKILIGVAESVFDDYSYTIKVNGTKIDNELWQTDVVDGYRVYVSDGFAASYITDKDHYVEVEVLKNEVSVQKVQCNVAGYCMKMAENAKMGELAKATYYYGVSAAKYVAIIKG